MRIAIDAYVLYETQPAGMANFTANLLRGLASTESEDEYILLTPSVRNTVLAEELSGNPRFRIIQTGAAFGSSRRIWLQSPPLVATIFRLRPDLFFGGAEFAPLVLPRHTSSVVTVHDAVHAQYPQTIPFFSRLWYRFILPRCIRRAACIITVSETSRQEIARHLGVSHDRIHVCPNSIDTAVYFNTGIKPKEDVILFVGTIQPRKNLANLLRAFAIAADAIPASLVIAGASGWRNSAVAEVIESLPARVRERITFMGFVADTELKALYRNARLFAAPSLHEGFGLIVLEAIASGTAVLTSPRGALKEFFDGAAFFCDPENPEDIAAQLLRLWEMIPVTPWYPEGAQRVIERHSLSAMAGRFSGIINTVRSS